MDHGLEGLNEDQNTVDLEARRENDGTTEGQLLRCRLERFEDEETRKLEEDRLQEIIRLCQSYNDAQEGKRVKSLTVNEGHRLLDLMKKPDVVPMSLEGRTTVETTTANRKTDTTAATTTTSDNQVNDYLQDVGDYYVNGDVECDQLDGCDDAGKLVNKKETISDDYETLNALSIEEGLIRGEIDEMKHQQFSDAEDEELKEFQRIEREIKLNELYKCLENIERQIIKIKEQYAPTSTATMQGGAPLATCETDDSTSSDDDLSLRGKVKPNHRHQMRYDDTNSESLDSSRNEISSNNGNGNQVAGSVRGRLGPKGDNREKQQRPLTIYLPSTSDELDLVEHISNLGHDVETFSHLVQMTPTTCSGYLWKLCSNTENQWRKRYFLFDRQHKVFVYFKSFKSFIKVKKAKYGVFFNQIEDAYVDHNRTKAEKKISPLTGSLRRKNNNTRHVFVVVTSERNFTLSSFVPEVMRIWIDVIFTGAEGYLNFE